MISASTIFDTLGGGGSKIPVGIHAECSVTSIDIGDNYIDFNYEDSKKRVHNKRVWFPDPDKVYPRPGEFDNEAYARDVNERLAHIVKHMGVFMDKEDVMAFSAPSVKEFAMKAAATLTPLLPSTKVNLMLIYDADGKYSTFGRYPNYIERWTEGEEPNLRPSRWEEANRMTPAANPNTDDAVGPGPSTSNLY